MVGLIVVAALVVSMIRQPEVYTWSGGSTSLGERQNWSVYCLHHRFPSPPHSCLPLPSQRLHAGVWVRWNPVFSICGGPRSWWLVWSEEEAVHCSVKARSRVVTMGNIGKHVIVDVRTHSKALGSTIDADAREALTHTRVVTGGLSSPSVNTVHDRFPELSLRAPVALSPLPQVYLDAHLDLHSCLLDAVCAL